MNKLKIIKEIIKAWKINRLHIACKIGMNYNTFKLKLNPDYPLQHFTDTEIEQIVEVLKEMGHDITLRIIEIQ